MNNLREFAHSTNGDRWFLGTDEATNELLVLHRGNEPSGGHETEIAVQAFLDRRPSGPEREALVAALGVTGGASDSLAPSSP